MRFHQRGQSLVYALFWLMGGLAALFFLFHTGQAVRLKSRLVNAADAVALSAGHLQARALNVTALHNRALLANEVMLAQMVGISSWTAHAQTHLAQLPWVHPECADAQGTGAGTGALFKYGPSYALMCYLASQGADMVVGSGLASLPAQATFWAAQTERYKLAIQQAQRQVFDGSEWQVQQQAWMQAVAHANLPGFPELDVEAVDAAQGWDNFTQWRAGEGRRPLADMARQALAQDPFSQDRRWTARALLPTPECFPALEFDRFNEVRRRGSTELVGLDEWRAVDTQSFHAWRLHKGKGLLPRCEPEETPTSWGSQAATGPGADNNGETSLTFGESRTDNPQAHALASTNAWSFYSGLPIYRSLSDRALAAKDARLPLTVRLALSAPNLGSGAGSAGVVNAYKPAWAGGQMVALSSVEVYFERPFDDPHNAWGQTVGRPVELPSLFNPFWHARLIDVPSARTEQQLRQGAQTP